MKSQRPNRMEFSLYYANLVVLARAYEFEQTSNPKHLTFSHKLFVKNTDIE